jgi:hypothetical protein
VSPLPGGRRLAAYAADWNAMVWWADSGTAAGELIRSTELVSMHV